MRAFIAPNETPNSPNIRVVMPSPTPAEGKRDVYTPDEDQQRKPSGVVVPSNKTKDEENGPHHDQTSMATTDDSAATCVADNDSSVIGGDSSHNDKVHEANGTRRLATSETPDIFTESEEVKTADEVRHREIGTLIMPGHAQPPAKDHAYVLGVGPILCKCILLRDGAEYVTGMLPFKK